ncbi:hypothetical protein [Mitsuaria sp. GD03876]|uniref:hypothetical protein n=1 Tax=Mitsuaria sp. GD03876 TaxID=2975399 RepID=UPI00244A507C|nr:hypothetical protein [Mitsuaria sp. GD03876]MDH0865423.1 hypothetical protein [Mitsuaria sp. GD03876]
MHRSPLIALVAAAATLILSACAAPETKPEDGKKTAEARQCVQTLGTNLCRRTDQGALAPVNAVSGDALRLQGGELVRPTNGTTGN